MESQLKYIRAALVNESVTIKELLKAVAIACENEDRSDEALVSVGWLMKKGRTLGLQRAPPGRFQLYRPDETDYGRIGTDDTLENQCFTAMTPEEWVFCDDPFRLIVYLRGEVDEVARGYNSQHNSVGSLYEGDSPHASERQCIEYATRSHKLWALVTGRPLSEHGGRFTSADEAIDLWRAHDFSSTAAWVAADIVAKESMRSTCPDATEDDRVSWSWGGGPPDRLWQATRAAFEVLQSSMLRDIFEYPGISATSTPSVETAPPEANPATK